MSHFRESSFVSAVNLEVNYYKIVENDILEIIISF
jgi:hypothetical protein